MLLIAVAVDVAVVVDVAVTIYVAVVVDVAANSCFYFAAQMLSTVVE